ncbi:MAG: hypothetical protein ABSF50_00650 [Burkholderiaceae bacterium]
MNRDVEAIARPPSESDTEAAINEAAINEATARLVNRAVEKQARNAAHEEQRRQALERRVWRWALVALLGLCVLGMIFTGLSRLHLL